MGIESRWVDAAALTTFLIGLTLVFGRFERHKPAWRRLAKIAVLAGLLLLAIEGLGRAWGYAVLGLLLVTGTAFHFIVLSKRGINGWTGEPSDKFEALLRDIRTHGELRTLLSIAISRRRSSP